MVTCFSGLFLEFSWFRYIKKMSAVDSSFAAKCMDFCHALTSQKKSFTFSLILGSSFTFSLDTKEDRSPVSKAVRRKSPSAKRRNERRRAEFLVRRSETQGTEIQVAADIIDVTLAPKDGLQDSAHQVVLNLNEDTPQSLPSSILSPSTTALCGYPLVKVPVEKICSFAPILLRFDYFRQNIWRLFFAQFHFWYIYLGSSWTRPYTEEQLAIESVAIPAGCRKDVKKIVGRVECDL